MAPKRHTKTAARTPSSRHQSTLSFHGKPSKVTKASSTPRTKSKEKDPLLFEDVVQTDIRTEADPDLVEPSHAENAIQKQTKGEAAAAIETTVDPLDTTGRDTRTEDILGGRAAQSVAGAIGGGGAGWVGDEGERARKITDVQIKQYWRRKEEERLAPRVHQEDLSVHEKVLREWDMSGQYGPCIGIARLKRWKRANLLGLQPPMEVLAVLLKEMGADETDGARMQRAHVDELMSSRFTET